MRTTNDLQRPRRRLGRLLSLLALVALLLVTAGSAAVAPGAHRRQLSLAGSAPAGNRQPRLVEIDPCDDCEGDDLATAATLAGDRCEVVLDVPAIRRQASFWGVAAGGLAAVAVRRARESCLRATGIGTSDVAAVDAQARLAAEIGGPRLVDASTLPDPAQPGQRPQGGRLLAGRPADHGGRRARPRAGALPAPA
jgi:hypothetical protein